MSLPPIGCPLEDIDTPALCVDLDAFDANVRRMVGVCREHGVGWRPHSKCHKSIDIARRLIDAGAMGMTCAKLGEAEALAEGGVRDLLVANLVVGAGKVARLVELRRKADPIVCMDSIEQARPISAAMADAGLRLRVLIEVDIGLHRVGVLPEATLPLARELASLPGIELAGIMGYEGHLLTLEDPEEKRRQIERALGILDEQARTLRAAGIPCEIVSCGGTGSYIHAVRQPGITELQAGGAIFMDNFYVQRCHVDGFQLALTVATTVVSRPAPDRAIIDAGRKSLNAEIQPASVLGRPGLTIKSLSAEHGTLNVAPEERALRIGDRLQLVPGYGDLTTVLHDQFLAFRGGRLEAIWPLQGRGKLT